VGRFLGVHKRMTPRKDVILVIKRLFLHFLMRLFMDL